jgi:hypothetical protein
MLGADKGKENSCNTAADIYYNGYPVVCRLLLPYDYLVAFLDDLALTKPFRAKPQKNKARKNNERFYEGCTHIFVSFIIRYIVDILYSLNLVSSNIPRRPKV